MTTKGINPDFSFPATVAEDAEKTLQTALAGGDGVAALQSLMQLNIAKTLIDPSSLQAAIRRSEDVAQKFADSDYAPIITVYTATLYQMMYDSDSWRYNRRELPLTPRPEDITEWSGAIFKDRIAELCREGVAAADKAAPISLKSLVDTKIATADSLTMVFYPTGRDFAISIAGSLLEEIGQEELADSIFASACSDPEAPQYYAWAVRRADNAEELLKFYNPDVEGSGLVLNALAEHASFLDGDERTDGYYVSQSWLGGEIRAFLKRFPKTPIHTMLSWANTKLEAKRVSVSFPNYASPGRPIDMKVRNENVENYELVVYDVEKYLKNGSLPYNFKISKLTPDRVIPVECSEEKPFRRDSTLEVNLPNPGHYVIIPRVDGVVDDNHPNLVFVTSVLPFAAGDGYPSFVAVVDPISGKPVKGAVVKAVCEKTVTDPVTTDADGMARIYLPQNENRWVSYHLSISYGGYNYNFGDVNLYSRSTYGDDRNTTTGARVLADRAIYHPGEEINALLVAYRTESDGDKSSSELLKGAEVSLVLKNVNYKEVGRITGTTDEYGRFSGTIVIPDNGDLTGTYRLSVEMGTETLGSTSVTVSDYKMPDFEIADATVYRDEPEAGAVTVRGRLMTYSGMPLAGADVDLELSVASWFRWFAPTEKIYAATATSDGDGRFEIVLGKDIFSNRTFDKYFVAALTATSPSGTSAESMLPVVLGKPYRIDVATPETNVDGQKPFLPAVSVTDAEGNDVKIALNYALRPADDKEDTAFAPLTLPISLRDLVPGSYELTVAPEDSTLADPAKVQITVFNTSTDIVPGTEAIWIEKNSVATDSRGKASILFGTPLEQAWVYVFYVGEGDKIVNKEMKKVKKGYHTIDVTVPADAEAYSVFMAAANDFSFSQHRINISLRRDNSLTIIGESFRDRLQPGTPETWQIRISGADGTPVEAALALDMYNKALDAIVPQQFGLRFPSYVASANMSWDFPSLYFRNNSYAYSYRGFVTIELPEFYDYGIFGGMSNRYGHVMYRKSMPMPLRSSKQIAHLNEELCVDSACETSVMASGASPVYGDIEEAAVEEEEGGAASDNFDYRDSEVALAVWAPMLTTDADGNVTYTFTVPNANTTWRLAAVAWTKDMKVGSLIREFVASKPVMVMPNVPRYLRQGDEATIQAVVMNNSDDEATVRTVVEFFDPISGRVIESREFENTLAGMASATVGADFSTVGFDGAAVGYRVRSSNGSFSDGEQTVIRILPSMAQLVETEPFYLNPDEKVYRTVLFSDAGARISLTFCENPVWTVVSAIPGLRSDMNSTANSAAAALFSAAVARGIIKDNPAIGDAIREWLASPSDSTLVSMLEKNEDLKVALLNATPWMQDASSDTERMARLVLIFNDKETDAAIKSAVKMLNKLQRADGGWAWCDWSRESSLWVTSNVLEMLANLKIYGWMPEDTAIAEMTRKALKFWDSDVEESDMLYSIIRPVFFDEPVSANGKAVIARTVKDIERGWKKYSDPAVKSMAALTLWRNGKTDLAATLMKSVGEFGVVTPSQGMTFPRVNSLSSYAIILEAFAVISPENRAVDGIRQQLIVRKQSTDWGSAVVTTQVVASILSCGSVWTVPAEGARIEVGSTHISADTPMEKATGSLRVDLSAYAGETLAITSSGVGPAYGCVFSQFARAMADVESASIPDLSVEKTLLVRRGTEWEHVGDTLAVGDRVRVQLTIHSKRNMQYVAIVDDRPAAFEPVDQVPGWLYSDGVGFYRENRDSATNLYVDYMRPGTYILTYDMNVAFGGKFSSGVATIQSQYAPDLTAHSAGVVITVK